MPTAPPKDYDATIPVHQRLLQSVAFKKYLATPAGARPSLHHGIAGGREDKFMTDLMADVGRTAPPQVLDSKGIDDLGKKGWVIGYRGVGSDGGKTGKQIQDQASYGGHYSGAGIYGNGVYMAAAADGVSYGTSTHPQTGANVSSHGWAKSAASGYGGTMTRYAVPPTARVIDHAKLTTERDNDLRALRRDLNAGKITRTEFDAASKVMADVGRYAVLKNYDGITVHNGYFVLLNRSIAAMQKDNL